MIVGSKAKVRASAYFTKLRWRRRCVFMGGVGGGVCEGVGIYVFMVRVVGVC